MVHEVEAIQSDKVEQLIKDHVNIQIIDVQENEEVSTGKIPQALHIRLSGLPESYN